MSKIKGAHFVVFPPSKSTLGRISNLAKIIFEAAHNPLCGNRPKNAKAECGGFMLTTKKVVLCITFIVFVQQAIATSAPCLGEVDRLLHIAFVSLNNEDMIVKCTVRIPKMNPCLFPWSICIPNRSLFSTYCPDLRIIRQENSKYSDISTFIPSFQNITTKTIVSKLINDRNAN